MHNLAGQGSFGTVYKANYRGQEVAAKVLNSQMDRRQLAEFQKFASLAPHAQSQCRECGADAIAVVLMMVNVR